MVTKAKAKSKATSQEHRVIGGNRKRKQKIVTARNLQEAGKKAIGAAI